MKHSLPTPLFLLSYLEKKLKTTINCKKNYRMKTLPLDVEINCAEKFGTRAFVTPAIDEGKSIRFSFAAKI